MLQIKTIVDRLEDADQFDNEVNAAIAEGWMLKKREVLLPRSQSESLTARIALYAELERVVITEAERGCDNCRYCDCDATLEPCANCSENADKWEPMDG